MNETRQSPDEVLKQIKSEEKRKDRGHLKIFFGYAAGVGKTYAMLKAARVAKRRGVDVVAGYIEPHARPQTSALATGLEVIPNLVTEYNGIHLSEFNLDAALERKPQLVLVDELAHTNAPVCRHTKRYQDIGELLNAGIDVYTTVNVQHIESLNDTVASITGISVHERIPDSVFDDADQVELVDIEPQELIERLNAGNVYKETQAKQAVENFFTVENLTALREIALRRCADRVNLLTEDARLKSRGDYHTDEHILVCLSSSPSNAKIIRTAARMANAFHGVFTALFVETPNFSAMSEEDTKRLRSNMRLAEQLGAEIETVYGEDISFQISEFARLSGVSKIVIGRSSAVRKNLFSKPTLTEKLIAGSPNLDIHIIPDTKGSASFYQMRKQKKTKKEYLFLDYRYSEKYRYFSGINLCRYAFQAFRIRRGKYNYGICARRTDHICDNNAPQLQLDILYCQRADIQFSVYRAEIHLSGLWKRISCHISDYVFSGVSYWYACRKVKRPGKAVGAIGLQNKGAV